MTLPPSSYFLPTLSNGQQSYCFGIGQWNEDFAILGYTFMRGYPFLIIIYYCYSLFGVLIQNRFYILYDMDNGRIGIAGTNATVSADGNTLFISPSLYLSVIFLHFLLFF